MIRFKDLFSGDNKRHTFDNKAIDFWLLYFYKFSQDQFTQTMEQSRREKSLVSANFLFFTKASAIVRPISFRPFRMDFMYCQRIQILIETTAEMIEDTLRKKVQKIDKSIYILYASY